MRETCQLQLMEWILSLGNSKKHTGNWFRKCAKSLSLKSGVLFADPLTF